MKITGKLIHVERFDTSRNGNPRYYCVIMDENERTTSFYTAVDSSHGYSITNNENKIVTVELEYKRNKLTLQSIDKN